MAISPTLPGGGISPTPTSVASRQEDPGWGRGSRSFLSLLGDTLGHVDTIPPQKMAPQPPSSPPSSTFPMRFFGDLWRFGIAMDSPVPEGAQESPNFISSALTGTSQDFTQSWG